MICITSLVSATLLATTAFATQAIKFDIEGSTLVKRAGAIQPLMAWDEDDNWRMRFNLGGGVDCSAMGTGIWNTLGLMGPKKRNFQCWSHGTPGWPYMFDVSAGNSNDGKFAMACAIDNGLGNPGTCIDNMHCCYKGNRYVGAQ